MLLSNIIFLFLSNGWIADGEDLVNYAISGEFEENVCGFDK